MKYGSFEFGDKKNAEKPMEQALVAGAVSTILSRDTNKRLASPGNKAEDSNSPDPELSPSGASIPERKINPVRRNITEKERTIRSIALKQVLETPLPEADTETESAINATIKPPVPVEQMQPIRAERTHKSRPVSGEIIRNVEQSSTEELLRAASTIHIEGTTVRKLYETNQIDHRGLVAIMKEGLRGGDVKNAYSNARLGAEAQQGRKIEMRHDDPSFIPSDSRPEISDFAKKRVETITSALEAAQHSTPASAEARTQSSVPTPADHGYQQVKSAMRKKRIATISISLLAASGAAAVITWFLIG